MTSVQIITPTGMLGASSSDDFIDTAMRVIGVGFGDPNEWASKYGTDYENDIFMMHRFCWCERDDCPWCAGCGEFEDACKACNIPHKPECLQAEIDRDLTAWLGGSEKYCDGYFEQRDSIAAKLAPRHGVAPNNCRWECDCGTDEAREAARETDGCDYSTGRGIFARFGKNGAPNFWFKPNNFQLTWYKYIGRSMKAFGDGLPGDFLQQIFATHPKGMTVDQAIKELARREEENAKAFREMFDSLGVEHS